MSAWSPPAGPTARVPKLVGADTEFANFIDGVNVRGRSARVAAQLLLHEVDGPPAGRSYRPDRAAEVGHNPQDVGRRFQLGNGGCVYEDLTHYEACIPEVLTASDFTAAVHASFLSARAAAKAASARLPGNHRVVVLANNTDGVVSWGAHFNVATSRTAFRNLVRRLYPSAFFLGAFQASSQLFTGQGKVGAANGHEWCNFQLSQRADFIETFSSHNTTSQRPLVNARDESLCGRGEHRLGLARLHMISFDHTLQHVATYLKCGATQLIVAMIEAGCIEPALLLEDTVNALWTWSRDPDLRATAPLAGGQRVTLVDHQALMAEHASRFVESGEADAYVPEAHNIVALWENIITLAQRRDFQALASCLDWALKREMLQCALDRQRDLDWQSPKLRHLDLMYASVLEDGLYFRNAATLQAMVSRSHIERFMREPPEDTRAWTRAMLLRAAARHHVEVVSVDWDHVTFRLDGNRRGEQRTVSMANPLGHTQRDVAHLFDNPFSFPELLDRLSATSDQEW